MKDDTRPCFSRRIFLGFCLTTPAAIILGNGCKSLPLVAEDNSARAIFVAKRPSRLRILQFTDLHYFSTRDDPIEVNNNRINELMQTLVKKEKPDLVIITGDVCWPDEPGMRYAVAQFGRLGVSWAFTWGNHDHEHLPNPSIVHQAFTHAENSLYRGGTSDGNYVIDIVTSRGQRMVQILCINSKVDGIGEEQRAWLRKIAETDAPSLPRFAFFHIPIKQYEDVWRHGDASGIKGEKASFQKENGSTLPLLKALNVKACFCGHDHTNDYSGSSDGIELVYGRATGGGKYATRRFAKGGKIIDIDCRRGTYRWQSVTERDAPWHPKPGERIDDSGKAD